MSRDVSVRAFKCPSCGGPLEPETGTLTMKCPYCGSTVIIPESLRTAPPAAGPTIGEAFQFGLNGVDLNKIVGNAMHLPQAISLAQQGKLDQAADIYSQITGMEHADALVSIKSMAAGRAVSLTPGRPGVTWGQGGSGFAQPGITVSPSALQDSSEPSTSRSGSRGCGMLVGIIVAVIAAAAVFAGAALYFAGSGRSSGSILPAPFASQSLAFGTEGIGAGMFQDPRSIGLDRSGNITVADYQDGRVQTFDPTGKPAASFSLASGTKKVYISGLGVAPDGTVYIVHDQRIFEYNSAGKKIGEIADDKHNYESVVVGGDGKLYALADQETIVRFKPDGSIDLEIPDTFTQVTGDMDIDTHLAADGLGNMYILGSFHYLVLKYSPDGKFLDQFGGETKSASVDEPGKFTAPLSIGVDGYGRIFVADFSKIQVFDADGTYVNQIPVNNGAVFGMAFDDQNRLYTVTNQSHVTRYDVQAPASK